MAADCKLLYLRGNIINIALLWFCSQLQSASCCFSSSRSTPPAMDVSNVSVAVVGAGASGLAAAAALCDAGIKNVVVLEASDRIGGRIKRYTTVS